MAGKDAGRTLTPDEVREYVAYGNAGLARPDKFAGVVFENTSASGAVYRFPTDAERTASEQAASAAEAAAKADADLLGRIQAEAAKRRPAAPDAPDAPAKPQS